MERNRVDLMRSHQDDVFESEELSSDDKLLAALAHFGSFIFGLVCPLVIWIIKKDESNFVAEHAKESLNFQLSISIYLIGSFILMFLIIGLFVAIGLALFASVVILISTIRAAQGHPYKYPLSIPFIK
ncbi:MAG: DUF4870 domain-containing protein [Flavobacteriales bacterium]|nr:DUF4870 domain-containing protein [Flavobacteriales bacterium]